MLEEIKALSVKMFQFYDSPIKRSRGVCRNRRRNAFQFYDSPIKSIEPKQPCASSSRFNSMIVRLKDHRDRLRRNNPRRFNSMIVRLKDKVEEVMVSEYYVSIL